MASHHSFRIVVTSLLPGLPMRSCHTQLRSELLPLLPTTAILMAQPLHAGYHSLSAHTNTMQKTFLPFHELLLFLSSSSPSSCHASIELGRLPSPIRIYRKSVLSLIGLGMGMIGILHRMQDLVGGKCEYLLFSVLIPVVVFLFSFAISALFLPLAVIENRYALFTNKHLRAGRGPIRGNPT